MSCVSSPLCCVCSWALWAEPMPVSLPEPGELSYRNIPNNSRAFICLNHLTDQAFVWDQAAIWDRRSTSSSQRSGMKMSHTSPASWMNSLVVVAEETIYPTSTGGKLLIFAVTHGGLHLFLHRPDHVVGHTFVACPFSDHPSLHVYLKLLASLCPPSTRQPGPAAVLLGETLTFSLIFWSLTLLGSTEKRLAAASPEFFSAYFTTESLNVKSYFLFFAAPEPWGSPVWYWLLFGNTVAVRVS